MNEKIYRPIDYPNQPDDIGLTSEDILKIIEQAPLTFFPTRNSAVEWKIRFPMFAEAFYDYIKKNKIVPGQQEFFDYFLLFNKEYFLEEKFSPGIMEGLKARIFRTYPSLVRDLHFNKYVKERLPDTDVRYHTELDTKEGIDLMISAHNRHYGISLYTQTKRALDARNKKQSRHVPFKNVSYKELPINLNECMKWGKFFIYGPAELNKLKKIIDLEE